MYRLYACCVLSSLSSLIACGPRAPVEGSPSTPDDPSSDPTDPAPEGPWCEGTSAGHEVFRELWSVFDERYAVFDAHLPSGDWRELGGVHCDVLGERPSEAEVFEALLSLVRELDDGHVNLCAPSLGRCEDAWVSVYPHYPQLYVAELMIEQRYLDGQLSWAANDWVAWGRIGDIGYLSLTSMDELSPPGAEASDVLAASQAMGRVLDDLRGARGMVVDVRANEGGWDAVSLELASAFAGERTVAWTEQIRNGPAHDDFSAPREVEVAASGPAAFSGPVVLLTSGGTFSAAETFALAMRVRDDVILLGEPTSGHLSDLGEGALANGWPYTLSGERYVAADGQLYEARGIPVDVEVSFDPVAMQAGRDVQLEAALELLSGAP